MAYFAGRCNLEMTQLWKERKHRVSVYAGHNFLFPAGEQSSQPQVEDWL